jgi:hypothetical protein
MRGNDRSAYGPSLPAQGQANAAVYALSEDAGVIETAQAALAAAHDPALGDDRSVCVRAVIDWMRDFYAEHGRQPTHIEFAVQFGRLGYADDR